MIVDDQDASAHRVQLSFAGRSRRYGYGWPVRVRLMASAELSRRVEKVIGYPPLSEMSDQQRRAFHEARLDADRFEDLPGKWQAPIFKAEENRPKLRLVSDS